VSTSNRAELGDASVPFELDVHAMIWSEDAPALENALHRELHYRRVNLADPEEVRSVIQPTCTQSATLKRERFSGALLVRLTNTRAEQGAAPAGAPRRR
jgi:hypothetical protein